MDKIDYLVSKVDTIASDIVEIKILDAAQNEQLKEHMRRTRLLETRVEQVDAEIKPLKSHLDGIRAIIKFVSLLAVSIGVIETLRRML